MKKILFLNVSDNYEENYEFGFTREFSIDERLLNKKAKELNIKSGKDSKEYFYVDEVPLITNYEYSEGKSTKYRTRQSLTDLLGKYILIEDQYLLITKIDEENSIIESDGKIFYFDDCLYFSK